MGVYQSDVQMFCEIESNTASYAPDKARSLINFSTYFGHMSSEVKVLINRDPEIFKTIDLYNFLLTMHDDEFIILSVLVLTSEEHTTGFADVNTKPVGHEPFTENSQFRV